MRPVRKLKKALDKTDSVKPLLMMQEEEEPRSLPMPPASGSASRASSRRLVLTNVAWKSWVPRLGVGLALVVSACVVVGLRPAYWNIALVMAVLGAFFLLKTKAETYTFDGDAQQFVWQRKTLFRTLRREFWFQEIQSVKLVELSDGQGGLDSNLYVCLSDGTRLKIFSGQLITLKDRSRVLAKQQIERFLASCAASDSESEHSSPRGSAPLLAASASPSPAASPALPETPVTPSGTRGMQRRITAVLGRGSARNKSPIRKLQESGGGEGGSGPPSNDNNDLV